MEVFKMRLKEAREERGYSQETVGDAIGVTRNAICYYERGKRMPSIDIIEKIAEFLKVDFFWLVGKEITATVNRKSNKIINISEEDWNIIRLIHSNPDLFNYLLDDTELKVAQISRYVRSKK